MIRVQQMKLFPVVWLPFVLVVAIAKGICRGSLDVGTADSGLRNNSVRAIVQTRDGYLWVGIHEGQARFDGVRFTVINRANTPANASNRVLGLYEDCEGRLFGYCSSYKEQRKNQSGLFPARLPEVRPPNLSRVHSLFNLLLAMGPGNYVDHYKQGQEIPCNYSCIGLQVDSHFVALLAKPHTYDERL